MVVTSRILSDRLGINEEIADYFANKRRIPQNNLFWQNKRIYLSAGFGYLTIPIGFDLFHKCGISNELLLQEPNIDFMENAFDRLRRFEKSEITLRELLDEFKRLLDGKIKQTHLADDVFALFSGQKPVYFQFALEHKALLRSDLFLLTLVQIDLTDQWVHDFLPYWYAGARPILLLDDFKDLEDDRRTNDENTIIELGNNKQAIMEAYQLGLRDLEKLKEINPKLSKYFKSYLDDALNMKYIQEQLTNQ